jgi:outer membrane protein insertion porin family
MKEFSREAVLYRKKTPRKIRWPRKCTRAKILCVLLAAGVWGTASGAQETPSSSAETQGNKEPASYVGIINFPGAIKAFSYTRLLQVVDVPEQSAYTPDLLAQGEKNLVRFFQVNGYFHATVHGEIERDDPHHLVNLIFTVDLNRLARVGEITIDGLAASQADSVRHDLNSFWARVKRASLKPGNKYSQKKINSAVDRIRGYLRNEGRLAPVVRLASSAYDASSNRAVLTFQVDPGPLLSVTVTGAHLWQRTIRKLVPIYEENSVDTDLVDEGERNLLSYFQAKGYFDVKAESHIDQQTGKVTLQYQVDRGAKHRVEGVYFQGNRYFDDSRLMAVVPIRKEHLLLGLALARGKYSDDLVQKSVDAITALYWDAGFAKVSVSAQEKDFEPQVDITFQISEGEQDKVASLQVEGNRAQSTKALTSKHPLNLQPGKPYSPRLLQTDRNQILGSYLDLGYLNADFHSMVTPGADNPHLMNVVYTIDEGVQGHVGDVVLLGTKITRPKFVESVTRPNVSTGQPLSEGKFFTAEGDLYNLGIFDWVSVKPLAPMSDQSEQEVLIKVHESPRYSLDIGGGVEVIPRSGNIPVGAVALPGIPPIGLGSKFTVSQKSFWGPRFSFGITRHDIRGRAETASFATVLSRLSQSGSFTYDDPHFHGSSWNSQFKLTAARTTENPLYTAELGNGSLQMQKYLDAKKTKTLIVQYSFQRTDLSNILIPGLVLPQDQRVRLSTFSAEYIRDTRDKPLDAHHGIYQTFDFGVTPTALGSSANFVRFLGQTAFYKPIKPWLVWANNVRLGFAVPFADSIVPLSERFFTGGADSLRGFPINGAGPQRPVNVCSNPSDPTTCTLISVPVGGDMLFIVNSEGRFPLPIVPNLGAAIFYDGGNVYANINFRQLVDDYTNTVGFGLRYNTPLGPVRFDIGYRVTSVPGVNATQYFVTIGQSF